MKFRAFDKEDSEMMEWGQEKSISGSGEWMTWQEKTDNATDIYLTYDKDSTIIMQFTGILDKKDNEIYFGDIVKINFHDYEHKEMFRGTATIVRTLSNGAGIMYDCDDACSDIWAVQEGGIIEDLWQDEDLWTLEVIGNIHENLSLIK